jgi:mitochondrial fission protein ELM1
MMANADAIVVTADSVNMVSEAVATGAPVHVFELPRGSARHRVFLDELRRRGLVRPFRGRLEAWAYEPLDTTPLVARALGEGLARHRAALGLE